MVWKAQETWSHVTHLSPGVSFIYYLAHDSGMLQSELFTESESGFGQIAEFGFLEIWPIFQVK